MQRIPGWQVVLRLGPNSLEDLLIGRIDSLFKTGEEHCLCPWSKSLPPPPHECTPCIRRFCSIRSLHATLKLHSRCLCDRAFAQPCPLPRTLFPSSAPSPAPSASCKSPLTSHFSACYPVGLLQGGTTGGHPETAEAAPPQSWRPEVQSQGVGRVGALQEALSSPLPASGGCGNPWCPWPCSRVIPNLCLHCHVVFLPV